MQSKPNQARGSEREARENGRHSCTSGVELLLSKLAVRERTLALLDAATGLRVSELLALRWRDVDFENLEPRVTRSIWHQVSGNCKTEAPGKPVPLDTYMAEDLLRRCRQSVYASDDHCVFAHRVSFAQACFREEATCRARGLDRRETSPSSHKYGKLRAVKTTLEIPDPLFRRAKSVAVERGIPLRAFVTEAVEEKLAANSSKKEKPWVRFAGGLRHLHKETARINSIVRREFETIEPEDWA